MKKLVILAMIFAGLAAVNLSDADAWFGKKRRERRQGRNTTTQTRSTGSGYNSSGGFTGRVPDSYFDQTPTTTVESPSDCENCRLRAADVTAATITADLEADVELVRGALAAAEKRLADHLASIVESGGAT